MLVKKPRIIEALFFPNEDNEAKLVKYLLLIIIYLK